MDPTTDPGTTIVRDLADSIEAWVTATVTLIAVLSLAFKRVRAALGQLAGVFKSKPPSMPPDGLVVLLAAGLAVAACAQLEPVYDRSLGPADTAPQRTYRLAGALDIVGRRLASEPQGLVVQGYWGRAEASFVAAYDAVSQSNAPPHLESLIGAAALDLYAVAGAAGLTTAMKIAPAIANPAALGMLPAELAVEAATAIPTYALELPRLRAELQAMATARADPVQAQWDARLASIRASSAAIGRR